MVLEKLDWMMHDINPRYNQCGCDGRNKEARHPSVAMWRRFELNFQGKGADSQRTCQLFNQWCFFLCNQKLQYKNNEIWIINASIITSLVMKFLANWNRNIFKEMGTSVNTLLKVYSCYLLMLSLACRDPCFVVYMRLL